MARRFDEFMHDALYGPEGFYTRGGRAGRRGDFLTSPEVGPLFGAIVANLLDAEWRRLGTPKTFTFVDAGAGPGTLVRSILAAAPEVAEAGCLRIIAVEISAAQREQHPGGVVSTATLSEEPFVGVILANELLDNLPFRLMVHDGAWREAYVDSTGSEVLRSSDVNWPAAPHGARAPLQDAARQWVDHARSLVTAGRVIAIDYMTPRTTMLAHQPWRQWLRTYRGHERGGHYLAAPGTQDITAEVAIDQLPEPDTIRSQVQWLHLQGITELVEEGKRVWAEEASRPGLRAMRMRSRIAEAEALLDPAGLGGFTVLEWVAPGAPQV